MAAYSIGAVARQTRLSTDTIRAWERRYGLVSPHRGAGGIRRYSESEIARLVLARRATELGHPIHMVAALDDAAIAALVDAEPASPPARNPELSNEIVVAMLLETLLNDDIVRLKQTVTIAATLMDPVDLALRVFAPLLAEIGSRWEGGSLSIWQEHLLSELIGTTVRAADRLAKDEDSARMLLATPPWELHAFATAFASMIASSSGFRAYNLGVSVPVAEVVAAAKRLQVGHVAIGVTCTTRRAELADYFKELDRELPRDIVLWAGGLSSGEIVEVAHRRRLRTMPTLEAFADAIQCQAAVCGVQLGVPADVPV